MQTHTHIETYKDGKLISAKDIPIDPDDLLLLEAKEVKLEKLSKLDFLTKTWKTLSRTQKDEMLLLLCETTLSEQPPGHTPTYNPVPP